MFANEESLLEQRSCSYQLPHERTNIGDAAHHECRCFPKTGLESCHCTDASSRWARQTLSRLEKTPRQLGLIAYIRLSESGMGLDEQLKLIQNHCSKHGYYVVKTFVDKGRPSFALNEALQASEQTNGLIAIDLNRFVEHSSDRLRDLRPFIHHFFCHTAKHLITVKEGIDTGTTLGQQSAVEIIIQRSEDF